MSSTQQPFKDLGLGLLTLLLHYFCLYLHFCYFLPVVLCCHAVSCSVLCCPVVWCPAVFRPTAIADGRVRWTISDEDDAERSRCRASRSAGRQRSSMRYGGANPCRHLYMRTTSLKSNHSRTFSLQPEFLVLWSSCSRRKQTVKYVATVSAYFLEMLFVSRGTCYLVL